MSCLSSDSAPSPGHLEMALAHGQLPNVSEAFPKGGRSTTCPQIDPAVLTLELPREGRPDPGSPAPWAGEGAHLQPGMGKAGLQAQGSTQLRPRNQEEAQDPGACAIGRACRPTRHTWPAPPASSAALVQEGLQRSRSQNDKPRFPRVQLGKARSCTLHSMDRSKELDPEPRAPPP